ncbi:FadR/GntR family transcriptional regulator [Nguyenibacter vanlangensis]|nr:FCD domain-containing protein [Nguyenibacter vanlangensis]
MPLDKIMRRTETLSHARRQSLVDFALDALREHIGAGTWPVGSRIPNEAELGNMLQIGRNTVREAIRVLSHAGVLEVRQGDGTYVRSIEDPAVVMRTISRSSLRDHFELRAMLEIEGARLAASRRSPRDLRRIESALTARGECNAADNVDAFLKCDAAFHLAIVEASRNGALIQLYRYFLGMAQEAARSAMIEHGVAEPGQRLHARLFRAIEAGDVAHAARAARAVLRPLIAAFSLVEKNVPSNGRGRAPDAGMEAIDLR